jgi:5-methylcytosine-specific restriction endonuclease McrA
VTRELELKVKRGEALLIAYISEIARRKAHLDLGYGNLFSFVTEELGVAEGAAGCRIQVARVCQKFPEILVALADGQINLTVAARLSPVLTAENCDELIQQCSKRSSREVLALLADLELRHEQPVRKPSITKASPFGTRVPTPAAASPLSQPSQLFKQGPVTAAGLMLQQESLVVTPTAPAPVPAAATARYNLKLSISEELKGRIDRLAEVLGVGDATSHLEEILEKAVGDALTKRDPICRQERGEARAAKAAGSAKKDCAAEVSPCAEKAEQQGEAISAKVRAAALQRAGYRCEFIGREGHRCAARGQLQIDHVVPRACGGRGHLENVQVLCRTHNLRKAGLDLGEAFIQRKIEAKRAKSGSIE